MNKFVFDVDGTLTPSRQSIDPKFSEFIISNPYNYSRLTIPSNTWFAFQGIDEKNIIMSVSSVIHDPNEVERKDLSSFDYDWSKDQKK